MYYQEQEAESLCLRTIKDPLKRKREAGNKRLIEDYFVDDAVYAKSLDDNSRCEKS